MFDLSVFTKGSRDYAEAVAYVLDPEGLQFGQGWWRVMSREDCFMGRQKRLDVVLAPDGVVLIVGDKKRSGLTITRITSLRLRPIGSFCYRRICQRWYLLYIDLKMMKLRRYGSSLGF